MKEKHGQGTAQADKLLDRLKLMGVREGIHFDVDGRIGSTQDAHRLLEFAFQEGGAEVQGRVAQALFEGHFERGEDYTDREWLTGVGISAGLNGSQVREWMDSGNGVEEVNKQAEHNRTFTQGVPRFSFQGKYVLEGAQDVEDFFDIFLKIVDDEVE
jgi:predicted DsbA family dithiol-disulfide isomerase